MPENTYINIKDLPESLEILNGDYILIETSNGTNIINFENFILPTKNTLITNLVNDNTTAIYKLSSDLTTDYNSKFTGVSAYVGGLKTARVFKTTITIPQNESQGSGVFENATDFLISLNDIIIIPANDYAAKNGCFALEVKPTGLVTIQGVFPSFKLQLNNTSDISITGTTTISAMTASVVTNVANISAHIGNTSISIDVGDIISKIDVVPVYNGNATEQAIYNVFAFKQIS